jgi:hypothetical protein
LHFDEAAIRYDPQVLDLLNEVAAAVVAGVPQYTRVDIKPAHSEAEVGLNGPEVIIGAKDASAVSVEFGTRYRYASAPIRKSAMALGLKVPP